MGPNADEFFNESVKWREEFTLLREIMLGCHLTEELKWGVPCYTFQNKNIALIHGFKEYCALLFVNGSLLSDPKGILIRQSEHTQAARQARFTGVGEIMALEPVLKAYVQEAIEAEKAGLKVNFKSTAEYAIPEEFRERMENNPPLRNAFEALTPGRQRAYILYFSAPKQSKTREARIEKYMRRILDGKGLND